MALNIRAVAVHHSTVRVYHLALSLLAALAHGSAQDDQPMKTLSIPENSPPSVYVGNLALRPDAQNLQIINSNSLVSDGTTKLSDSFTFDPSGNVYSKRSFDRESVSSYSVAVFDETSNFYAVDIVILDVNDNAPRFPNPVKNVTVLENTKVNEQLAILGSAVDPDYLINSTQRYEIVSGNSGQTFRLEVVQVGSNDKNVILRLNGTLDFEQKTSYRLVIRAFDGGGLFGDLVVNVAVGDVNDVVPEFDMSIYRAQVFENATVGQKVLTVHATDPEAGVFGIVIYELTAEDSSTNFDYFAVDSSSGDITTRHQLDYIQQRDYRLRVTARNPDSTQKSSSAVVYIQVVNLNDQAPVITVDYLYSGLLPENIAVGTHIVRLSLDDQDQADGNFTVQLSGDRGKFKLNQRDRDIYFVDVSSSLDREAADKYNITVTVWDSGLPPLSASVVLSLHLSDVNDHPPTFSQQNYTLQIEEHTLPGSPVGNVTARDPDIGENGRITYSLQSLAGMHSEWFSVQSGTGLIQTARELIDCETDSAARFVMVATDNGVPLLSATALVMVNILGGHDNPPMFDRSFYSAQMPEDSPIGSFVLQVAATDSECGQSLALTYGLADINNQPFEIESLTGRIKLKASLDYEQKAQWDITVTVLDRGGLTSSVTATLSVTDVNDNRPVFYPVSYAANVRATTNPGETLVVVKATDADSGFMGTVSYALLAGNSGTDYFELDTTSGAVKLKKPIPESVPGTFVLLVSARDGPGLTSELTANVTLIVIRGGSQLPQFSTNLYQFSITENSQPREFASVQATVQGNSQGITYILASGDPRGYFSLNPTTGALSTTLVAVDRELSAFLTLNIRAERNGVYGNAQANVTVLDINDNAPKFALSFVTLNVLEDQTVGETIFNGQASDADSGLNGNVRYQLTHNPGNVFAVNVVSGALTIKNALDYETISSYALVVQAYDQGQPSLSSELNITVVVVDINDNNPVFSLPMYEFHLSESSKPLSEIGSVVATDKDSGQNSRLFFSIVENQTDFGIYPTSGKLFTEISFATLELRIPFSLTVKATDNGQPKLSTLCSVRIYVTDENDSSPQFSQQTYAFSVAEDKPPGTQIGSVTATDADAGDNAKLIFSLPLDITSFRVDRYSGSIFTSATLDRETAQRYEIPVTVSDSGNPPNSAITLLRVTVSDINDNAPAFQGLLSGVIPAYINENRSNGTSILEVTALDPDEGDNAIVVYSLVDGSTQYFSIEPSSGWMKSRVTFDREKQSVYNVTVRASDSGRPRLASTAIVMVHVLDQNEAPQFTAAYVELMTNENVPIGSIIGRIQAYDEDKGENGLISYLVLDSNQKDVFDVNMTSGAVFVTLPVDAEKETFQWLLVRAVDQSPTNPQSTTINVTIRVLDLNDNEPQFRDDPSWFSVVENSRIDEVVGQVTAVDADRGVNGEVVYEIASQYPELTQQLFVINLRTGQLRTAANIDYELTPSILLVIKATDKSVNISERLHSTMTAVINVVNLNDNFPVFISRNVTHIAEDEAIGFPLLVVIATDADRNDSVRYAIISGDPDRKFSLDADTGELRLNGLLDRELTSSYTLRVNATDRGNPPNQATQLLIINVTDVNDNKPQFLSRSYFANVSETAPPFTPVQQVKAVDPDEGINAQLIYFIPIGLADDAFVIDANGTISTTGTLDRENKSSYVFSAYVQDGGFPALYDWCSVTVSVTDYNDNSPFFALPEFFQTVPENLRDRNTSIFQVVAEDIDEGDNALISYSIINVLGQQVETSQAHVLGGNQANKFSVDTQTGKIFAQSLDREQQERYTLTVLAVDHGVPSRSSQTNLIITVSDMNDNDPQFTNGGNNYHLELPEDFAPGSHVLFVAATDADKGNNSKITYLISNNGTDGKFSIDSETGEITTLLRAGHFDREKVDFYMFEVTARDNALFDPRSKQTWVEIKITDVNDNAPVFRDVPFITTIQGLVALDSTVLKVVANDSDVGVNKLIEYSIIGDNQFFKIDKDTGEIKVKESLVGVTGVQHIKLRATDKGTPPLYSDGYAEIQIGSPSSQQTFKFDNSTYTVYLDEDYPAGQLVLKPRAGPPSGPNSPVIYSLSGDVAESSNPFYINSSTGEIRVRDPSRLDYEQVQRYRVVVIAVSSGLTDYCTVVVNIRDVNDHSPVFTQDRYLGLVGELDNVTTYITRVLATDEDSGLNGEVEYRLIGDKASAFNIGLRTGIVQLAQQLDRETTEQVRVTIVATDKGSPARTGTTILRVTVLDANDNPPTFTNLLQHQEVNPVLIKEDTQLGQEVYVVSALDPDLAPIVTFDFTSGGNPGQMFNLDYFTGRITLASLLDREKISSYVINLLANDSLHVIYGRLFISVVDVNDNAPIFLSPEYQVTVPELMPPNSPVLQVNATDADAGANGRITYSLQGNDADRFLINASNGWIMTRASLDYSNEPTLNLAVKAADGGVPELSALVFVQIRILDVNNYAPRFSSPQGYTKYVPEDHVPGVTVLQVAAFDNDESPENKHIVFSLIAGNQDGCFTMENLEANIGDLVLKKALDRETQSRYNLTVMALDSGSPSKNSTVSVEVRVSDVNDWAPTFINTVLLSSSPHIPAIVANVSEGIALGSLIVIVQATDRDIGDNALIDYMIISGNDDGLFQINQTTGEVRLAASKSLDYDTKTQHIMQVRSTDNGVPRQTALATILINVSDINDNKPSFQRLMYLETVKEGQPAGVKIFTAQAFDQDAGIYGQLSYRLIGDQISNFRIDSETGDVTSAVTFNYEGQQTYKFNVSAVDFGGLMAIVQVSVQVLSVDQHAPVFVESSYAFTVNAKQIGIGQEVGSVRAEDADRDDNGNIVYTLISESNYFGLRVKKDEAVIYVKQNIPGDAIPKEILTIKAWSGKADSLYSYTNVTVNVEGVMSTGNPSTSDYSKNDLSTTQLIIIIIVISLVVIIVVVVFVVMKVRNSRNKRATQSERFTREPAETLGRTEPFTRMAAGLAAAPPYGQYPYVTASHDRTDSSQYASSGRGSAESEDDADAEIIAYNTVPLHVQQRNKVMPDSGIQHDQDTLSEHSACDHQEYLARLGIDPKKIGSEKKQLGQSVESMHQFSDEGGGEADPLDISNLYNKLAEDSEAGEMTIKRMAFGEAPAQIGSLSSVTDAGEEFSGSYNWDYLLDWGPQYQPLADVFTEIARLKDETIQPKRKPVMTIPQNGLPTRGAHQPPPKIGGPPPIITATPPRVDTLLHRSREMSNLNSARTSQLTSMVSLPHSPLSHESSFSNLAFTPNFTPALSPLATRSPSVSTLQSGSTTPHRSGSRLLQPLAKHPSVSESDAEFRI